MFWKWELGGGVSGHIFFGHTFLLLSCFAPGLKAVLLLHWSKADRKVLDGVFSWWKQLCSFVCMQCYFTFPTVLNIICFMCIMCICMFWCVCVLWKKEKNLKQSLLIIVVFQQFTKHQTKTLHQSIRIYISWRMTTSWASWKYCNNGFTLLTFWWLVNSL